MNSSFLNKAFLFYFMRFCPICGKNTEETFCEEHKPNDLEHKDIIVRVCDCKKYFHRNQWLKFDSLKKVAEKISKDCVKEKVNVNALIDEEIVKKKFEVEVFKGGKTFLIPAKLQIEKCPFCSKKGSNYFESTMQLRPRDEELLTFVIKQVEKENAFISKLDELKEGYDLLLSSNKAALKIGRRLKKSFVGELKTSSTLHTRDKQRSKDLYRVTVCFRREK